MAGNIGVWEVCHEVFWVFFPPVCFDFVFFDMQDWATSVVWFFSQIEIIIVEGGGPSRGLVVCPMVTFEILLGHWAVFSTRGFTHIVLTVNLLLGVFWFFLTCFEKLKTLDESAYFNTIKCFMAAWILEGWKREGFLVKDGLPALELFLKEEEQP